jgi:hypothetical protein
MGRWGIPNVDGVVVSRATIVDVVADCACGWDRTTGKPPAIRKSARLHAVRTGHTVHVATTHLRRIEKERVDG